MSDLLYLSVVGTADHCENTVNHAPRPARFVWHHVLPQICNGPTVPINLVSLCDNCHYTVHAMMYYMRMHGGATPERRSMVLRKLAEQGYQAAVTAGTVDKLPDEGGSIE